MSKGNESLGTLSLLVTKPTGWIRDLTNVNETINVPEENIERCKNYLIMGKV